FVEQDEAISLLHDERGAVARAALASQCCGKRLPHASACLEVNAAERAGVAAGTVDHAVFNEGRAVGAVDGRLDVAPPNDLGGGLLTIELEQRRHITDAARVEK